MEALQACLVILAQRETKEIQQRPIWYTVSLMQKIFFQYVYMYKVMSTFTAKQISWHITGKWGAECLLIILCSDSILRYFKQDR